MKYIITDQEECAVGADNKFHRDIAKGLKGKVSGAGYIDQDENGATYVYGESIEYGIKSKQEDLKILSRALKEITEIYR